MPLVIVLIAGSGVLFVTQGFEHLDLSEFAGAVMLALAGFLAGKEER